MSANQYPLDALPPWCPRVEVIVRADTERVLFRASNLPDDVPVFRHEVAVNRLTEMHSVRNAVLEAFARHVRDGTARGERAWAWLMARESVVFMIEHEWFHMLSRRVRA